MMSSLVRETLLGSHDSFFREKTDRFEGLFHCVCFGTIEGK